MADCRNCGEPNSPECENCTKCGAPVGGRRSTFVDGGPKSVVGFGHIGSLGPDVNYSPDQKARLSLVGGTERYAGFQDKPPSVYVIPQIEIPVANTADYGSGTSSNTSLYTPATAAEIGNGAVDYVKFAEKMQADANQLAADLQSLKDAKGVSGGGAGGGVPDGPDCDTDVNYPANTFTIEVKSKFQVVPCEDPVPCEVTCSTFTVTGNDTVTLTNGQITITMDGSSLSISGATGTLDLGALNVTTTGDITAGGKSLKTHTHNKGSISASSSFNSATNTVSTSISGSTAGPN